MGVSKAILSLSRVIQIRTLDGLMDEHCKGDISRLLEAIKAIILLRGKFRDGLP